MDEIISTRRLVHIIRAFKIFGKKEMAMEVCVNRFDDDTKQAFMELYDKVDADFQMPIDERHRTDIIMTNSWSMLYDEILKMDKQDSDFGYEFLSKLL